MRRGLLFIVMATLGGGAAATVFWLANAGEPPEGSFPSPVLLASALVIAVTLTLANLILRWLRWHFLTRRAGARLETKDSLLIYTVTLPAILTPFYVGELLRAVLVGRRWSKHRADLVAIWFLERFTDLLVVASFLALSRNTLELLVACGAIWLAVVVALRLGYQTPSNKSFPDVFALSGALVFTLFAWILPGLALWLIVPLLKHSLPFAATLEAFSQSTIFGGLTGLPAGIAITGSSMIVELQVAGLPLANAILATAIMRAGTTWFAVALGVLAAWVFRARLFSLWQSRKQTRHFDEVADHYAGEIPQYVRERLLHRKIRVMQTHLEPLQRSVPLRGLDIGCGQGWYACGMAELGHEMSAIDESERQVVAAKENARNQEVRLEITAMNAKQLPFVENHFDFVYSINVMHHITNAGTRGAVMDEIVRVLKPGGIFFLHEINTTNPVFRFYMGYLFPLIRDIDEGIENWIDPRELPPLRGASWLSDTEYFTFLPDFIPEWLARRLRGVEKLLENSRFRVWSAHYMARLVKDASPLPTESSALVSNEIRV